MGQDYFKVSAMYIPAPSPSLHTVDGRAAKGIPMEIMWGSSHKNED